nr:hypothetical protein [Clostridia bacterium]
MQIGWIDFSKEDRDKVFSVMSLLYEPGTVDELGVGLVRDGFANYFFPGTSTVQKRAKYFLIVPYILQEAVVGQYGKTIPEIIQRIDDEEKDCGMRLYKKYSGTASGVGIIGSRVLPDKWVSRKPSSIYWNGICTYGISVQKNLSIPDVVKLSVYLRQKNEERTLGNRDEKAEEGKKDDQDAGRQDAFRFFDLPNGFTNTWKDTLDIELTNEEAVFLKNKILNNVPDTLLAWLLKNEVNVSSYDSFEALTADVQDKVPNEMKHMMRLACSFNRLAYAARVRYNVILSDGKDEQTNRKWAAIKQDVSRVTEVDLDAVMISLHLTNQKLRRFLFDFKTALIAGDENQIDEIIRNREINIKTEKLAKLCHKENYEGKWIGGEYLDYRFSDAKRLIHDIYTGVGGSHVSN